MGAEDAPVWRRATYNRRDATRAGLLAGTWAYFGLLILLPIVWMLREALAQGPASFLDQFRRPEVLRAFTMTVGLTTGTVVINTCFGVVVAYVLARQRFWGQSLINGLVDLPLALSPVIAGYMLLLLFGLDGWLGPLVSRLGVKIVFSWPGMLVATLFVTLPFVVREVGPVLAEIGREMDDAAATLGAGRLYTFFVVTIPSIKWGLLYGMTLTVARAIGEFGAVLVVSGNIIGKTQTATLLIHQSMVDMQENTAFAAAVALALVSFVVLLVSEAIRVHSQRTIEGGRPAGVPGGTEAPVAEYSRGDDPKDMAWRDGAA